MGMGGNGLFRSKHFGFLVLRGTTEHGTTERETAERDFFLFFFFLTKKQQQTNSKYISQNKGHAYILYPSRSI